MEFIDKLFGTRAADTIRRGDGPAAASTWRCVEIKANCAAPCDAVRELIGRRFLPNEIPELPLPGCNAASCRCSYRLHSDRRRLPRRDGLAASPGTSLSRREDHGQGS